METLGSLKAKMMLELPNVLNLIQQKYIESNKKFYNPKTLGMLVCDLYSSGLMFETTMADNKNYYLYIDDKFVNLQTFVIDTDINKVIPAYEHKYLKFFDNTKHLFFDGKNASQDDGFSIYHNLVEELQNNNQVFKDFQSQLSSIFFEYLEYSKSIVVNNRELFENIIASRQKNIDEMSLDFINTPSEYIKCFTNEKIKPIDIIITNGMFVDMKNTYLKLNDVYFESTSPYYNFSTDLKTLFIQNIIDTKIMDKENVSSFGFKDLLTSTFEISSVDDKLTQFSALSNELDSKLKCKDNCISK